MNHFGKSPSLRASKPDRSTLVDRIQPLSRTEFSFRSSLHESKVGRPPGRGEAARGTRNVSQNEHRIHDDKSLSEQADRELDFRLPIRRERIAQNSQENLHSFRSAEVRPRRFAVMVAVGLGRTFGSWSDDTPKLSLNQLAQLAFMVLRAFKL